MANFIKKYGLIIVGLALLFWVFYGYQGPTPEQKIESALQNLFIDAPRMKPIYEEAVNLNHISFVVKNLQAPEEGKTEVFADGHVVVYIDTTKVIQSHDRLEPVIAHELFHVRDFNRLGFAEFVNFATEDKNLPWDQRRLEQLAVLAENSIRAELLKTGHYGGMAKTREETLARNR